MRPETVMSLGILSLHSSDPEGEIGYRGDLVEELVRLGAEGVPINEIGIRQTSRGYYSEEVWDFVGRLALAGYVIQESPIRVTPKGLDVLIEYVQEAAADAEDGETVLQALDWLGVDRDRSAVVR